MTQTRIHGLIGGIIAAAAIGSVASMTGCGSNWRVHQEQALVSKPSTPAAPDWVQGHIPMAEDRVFFIGRSHTPDYHRDHLTDGEWGHDQHRRTPPNRVGYTVMDERDAVQSARNDVYDQVRQRLQPRSLGTTTQAIKSTVDVGTCVDCGGTLPVAARMPVQPACNEPCVRSRHTTWPNSASHDRCGNCTSSAFDRGVRVVFADNCGTCGDRHAFQAQSDPTCGSCPTKVSVSTYPWNQEFWPAYGDIQGRDLSLVNVSIDSVMPAMLAHVNEEEVYFEKWHVHEGDDPWGRPFAEGRDEWLSYKCWLLCSIPRAEYEAIVEDFRGTYQAVLAENLSRDIADRARRVDWESRIQEAELQWRTGESGVDVVYDYYDRPRR